VDGSLREATRDRRAMWAIFLIALGFFLLTGSREPPWSEGELIFEVAEALVERGSVEITWLTPPYSYRGPDEAVHAYLPILPSLAQVPCVLLLEALGPRWHYFATPLAAQVSAAFFAALACALFYALCRRIDASPRAAVITTIVLGSATILWVYARRPYGESLQAACFLGFVLSILRLRDQPVRTNALLVGVCAGLLLNTALGFLLSVLTGFAAVAVLLLRRRVKLLDRSLWLGYGFAPLLALFLAYNRARWGDVFSTGYEEIHALPQENIGWGLLGLTVSPGKSLFLYSPPLLLALFGLPRLWRTHRPVVVLLAGLTLPPMVAAAHTQFWSGGWCWGPRVWLFVTPVLLLPLAPWVDGLLSTRPRSLARWLRVGVLALFGLSGLGVQTVGNAFYWDHYIRLAHRVQKRWLGQANRRGAILKPTHRPGCDPCMEDMYGVLWIPALQPIAGQAWMLRHALAESENSAALEDAPWRRYTTLEIDVEAAVQRPRIDWWANLWIEDYPERRGIGIGLMALYFSLVVAGGIAARRAASSPKARVHSSGE
jgi:4-amino-4-deoxy-L-arabinose transferase-like glycosyltransferase